MIKKFIIIILIFTNFGIPVLAKTNDNNWEQLDLYSFIDKSGIIDTNEFYGYSFLLKTFNKGQFEPIRNIPVSYTISQYLLNCSEKTYKIGVIDSYNNNGDFLYGDYNKFASFQPIIAGTTINEVQKLLCKY